MPQNKSTFLNMLLTMSIVALIAAFLLSYVQQLTAEPRQKAKDARELEAIASVVKEFDNDPFAEKMIITTANNKTKLELYPARKDGVINSFAASLITTRTSAPCSRNRRIISALL